MLQNARALAIQGPVYGCDDLRFTREGRDFEASIGAGTRQLFRARVEAGPPPGLLAYRGGAPVGWIQVGPRADVPGWTVWTHPSPGGETAGEVAARADAVLQRARAALPDGDAVLVGHGHFSRVLAVRWIGLPATGGVHVAMAPAALTVLGEERGVPRIDHANLLSFG